MFDGETVLSELRGICSAWLVFRHKTRRHTDGVNNEQIAVGAVVPAETNVGTRRLVFEVLTWKIVDRVRNREKAQ